MLCTVASFTVRSRAGPISSAGWMSTQKRLSGSPKRCHSKLTDPLKTSVTRLAPEVSVTNTSLIFSNGSALVPGEGCVAGWSLELSGSGLSPGCNELEGDGLPASFAGRGWAVGTSAGGPLVGICVGLDVSGRLTGVAVG